MFESLPRLDVERSIGRPCPKSGMPTPIARQERRTTKEQLAKDFREAVWARDRAKCRATGKKLVKAGTTSWEQLGEVDHAYPRSTTPDRIYDIQNGLLLQKQLNRLRKVVCQHAPEFKRFDYSGPDDRG